MRRVRILSDEEIARRYGRRSYLPFSPGTAMYEFERAAGSTVGYPPMSDAEDERLRRQFVKPISPND